MTEKVKEYIASLRGKKIAFVGMGVANAPSALFLARHGLQVYACDSRDESYIGKKTCEELRACGVQFSLGKDYLRILPEMDIVSAATAFCRSKILGSVNVLSGAKR